MTNKGKDVKIKVNMHCEGCADTVRNCLRGFDGVEEIVTDTEKHEVIVKGESVDIVEVLERLRKKFNKNAELISPELPKAKKEEEKKKEEIPVKTVVLKIFMHCEGCVRDIKKSIYQMEGVLSVKPDMAGGTVAVKGAVEPPKLMEYIKKKTGKQAEIVKCCMNNLCCHCWENAFNDENVHSCSAM
ncbi:heavy metal-associated isoprenylated plant protein 8-like [Eucalyptus grandis]|uniref:heavy metal-associated isoprenylated plant protein 8-like n=1 Tax=Eucalyptus grandis TaxID=71139 RepID=UPI00192EFAA3|nr:heavy metal-associated isoprenylated plant protein 8-like [Eucalyptus grandis]